jgi:Arc/MetJ-type ribon-helix-helix transcriptional regulator
MLEMEIKFSIQQEKYLKRLVDEGLFLTIDEAVSAAVYDQEQRLEMGTYSSDEIREQVSVGLEASQRGEVRPFDIDHIRREGRRIIEGRRK